MAPSASDAVQPFSLTQRPGLGVMPDSYGESSSGLYHVEKSKASACDVLVTRKFKMEHHLANHGRVYFHDHWDSAAARTEPDLSYRCSSSKNLDHPSLLAF